MTAADGISEHWMTDRANTSATFSFQHSDVIVRYPQRS